MFGALFGFVATLFLHGAFYLSCVIQSEVLEWCTILVAMVMDTPTRLFAGYTPGQDDLNLLLYGLLRLLINTLAYALIGLAAGFALGCRKRETQT